MTVLSLLSVRAAELKVLMVGNSFSQSVLTCLPNMVKADKENKLVLAQMYIGGCTLSRHIDELQKSEKDSGYKPYTTNYPQKRKVNLPEMIKLERWDIVTIQQGSHESWQKDKFKPAAELIAYIRKNAPQAEIVIHQTWSYRNADKRIGGAKPDWGFDQQGMYERLTENYTALAEEYGFRIIPVGKRFRFSDKKTHIKYSAPPPEERQSYNCPDFPRGAGEVVGRDFWSKNRKTGEMVLGMDNIHLNNEGAYLQACVWFGFLFGKNTGEITFVPSSIGGSQADFLKACAQEDLDKFPQVKNKD